LGAETEIAPGLDGDERGPDAQRLASHQQSLAQYTESLATTLHEQSFADPAQLVGPEAATDPAAVEAAAEKLVMASELVLAAADAMLSAAVGIDEATGTEDPGAGPAREARENPDPDPLEEKESGLLGRDEIRELQETALQNILEALATLEPPAEEPQQGDENQGEPQPQEQNQPSNDQGESEPDESETNEDPGQLLQSVRDREAERHRRNRERNASGYEPVDKDW
jgi:hypothetical protein